MRDRSIKLSLLVALGLLASCQPESQPVEPEVEPWAVVSEEPDESRPAPTVEPQPVPPPQPPPTEPQGPAAPTPSKKKLAWLNSEIERQQKRAEELREYAERFDDDFHIGTIYNEYLIPQHACFVLGHLLRRGELVTHLANPETVDLSDTSADGTHAIRVEAHGMDNFAFTARRLLTMSPDERVAAWNVDCVGEHDIPEHAFIVSGGPRTLYTLDEEGTYLRILGDIDDDFAGILRVALDEHPEVKTIGLGSGGGSVSQAIKAGQLIRERGLDTSLHANCHSACPLVFLGGKRRAIWSPYPKLGFHQVYTRDGEIPPLESEIYHHIAQYVRSMGADPEYVLVRMWQATPLEMYFEEDGSKLCDSRIATWVQRICAADD